MRTRIAETFPLAALLALALVSVHVLDDAWWHAPDGASAAHGFLLGLPVLVAVLLWTLAAIAAPPAARVLLAFIAGVVLLADAGIHLVHGQDSGVGASDVTGLLLLFPGVWVLSTAAATLLRPKPRRGAGLRWAARLGAIVAAAAALVLLVMPLVLAMNAAHKPPMDVPQASLPTGHRDLTLRTADGVRIAASYIPPKNGMVIVVLHGSGGDRGGGPVSRAQMLIRNRFGVMMYDARGSGESSGRPENLGWTWRRDVRAVVNWLADRREVKRIGALGLSTGAEVALEAAAHDRRIRGVVAEGTQARQVSETRVLSGGLRAFGLWQFAIAQPVYSALTHAPAPESLDELISRFRRPILLISANSSFEREMNRGYKERASGSVQLWETDGPHTGALKRYPRQYERRVVHFFEDALGT